MPGPFPGMDPYLEAPDYWRGMHNRLITFMESALNVLLPEGFAANADERLLIVPPQHSIYPDVVMVQRSSQNTHPIAGNAAAVAERSAPHGTLIAYPEEIREAFLEIRSTSNPHQIITIIEVLSPTNKTPGVHRDEYRRKQEEILNSQTHLLEIDLLRGGMHTVAAPRDGLQQLGQWDYLVTLHRANQRYHYDYWFIRLQEPLPPVRIPLTSGVPDVELDLQAVFNQAYDAGPYRRLIDYRQEPPILLTDAESGWLDTLLREKGLRS